MEDLDEVVDRIFAGLEKKDRVINPKEKEIAAYHETGHALAAAFTPGADEVPRYPSSPEGSDPWATPSSYRPRTATS
jgi:cell division protease FtsH